MQKYIVITKDGQAMIFKSYEEAFDAAEFYNRTTGNTACVEQFWSTH